MFVGHLAMAFGAKNIDSCIPLPILIGASFGIDLLWPLFLLLGIETVVVDPGNTAFTALDSGFDYARSGSSALAGWASCGAGFVEFDTVDLCSRRHNVSAWNADVFANSYPF
jgi:hypothetical protein